MTCLTCSSAFEPSDLDANIDFEKVASNTPKWVVGSGQCVYWKGCSVTVIQKDNEGGSKETPLYQRDGQGTVPSGIELYMSGSGGKVKEE